jgi:hypothetical protein
MGYFKPWRRKIGIATLLMACLFVGGLIRSHSVRDTVSFWAGRQTPVLLISTSQFILWGKVFLDPGTGSTFAHWTTDAVPQPNVVSEISVDDSSQLRWFKIVAIKSSTHSHPFWVISYWSIVIPLTLLSVFLLLTKPRKSTPKKTDEPIPEKVI